MAAETAGRLTEILAREGVRVHRGDLLARTADYTKKNEIERISGELQERQRTLERLQAPAASGGDRSDRKADSCQEGRTRKHPTD